ncbi:hypothetical protein ACFS6H_20065 [Terrimonas rubra]|uniref:Uncharacterized protein n=1 Tax=Terrimonas rubra TaxID=1035890 RepID=A0ABW6A9Q4_9BACT
MTRTLSQILKEADKKTDLQDLINLWNEIAENKYEYPLIQIRFANEYISQLALSTNGCDLEKGKFYYTLSEMLRNEAII